MRRRGMGTKDNTEIINLMRETKPPEIKSKTYHILSKNFISEMAYKITDADKVIIETDPPCVIIKILCDSDALFEIFTQWIEEVKPLGMEVKVLRL